MRQATSWAAVFTVAWLFGANIATAQVEVKESRPYIPRASAPVAQAAPAPVARTQTNPQAEMFYQVQMLQQEVLELRGMVEEQAHEIKRLKQQRLDDYVDLDRRISNLSKGGATVTPSTPARPDNSGGQSALPPAGGADETQRYRSAINAVLKEKDYQRAITEFDAYLAAFPQGRFVPNAQYWLGEIYLLQGDLEQSRQWFAQMLDGYPLHDKASDAEYKLGVVYHKLGDTKRAREILTSVAGSSSNAARLAQDYLQTEMR